jgi:hypothetical protein
LIAVEDGGEDMGAVDGGFDAVSVVLLEQAEIFVAELVGDLFDGESGVCHEAGGGVAKQVGSPVTFDVRSSDNAIEFGA